MQVVLGMGELKEGREGRPLAPDPLPLGWVAERYEEGLVGS